MAVDEMTASRESRHDHSHSCFIQKKANLSIEAVDLSGESVYGYR